ncbi:MAG: S8 family serine peptidase [Burkholderiales bacterium]
MIEAAVRAFPAGTRVVPRLVSDFRVATTLGPTVAVIDTGLNINHVNFAGRVASGAHEVFGLTSDVTDTMGHGTAVASILLGQPGEVTNGLDSRVLPIRVFSGPTASDQNVSDGLRYSIGRALIVNMSLAATGPIAQTAMAESVAAGQLLVVAAGNRSQLNPDWPARYAKEDWAGGRIIAVGAVDANNAIASFSNRAGDTKNSFIVALGVGVIGASALSTSGLVSMSGTSAAAPIVAGAAASILAHWPYLSAEQISGILFSSATDLGAPGVDEIFGWGLLNLSRALQPIGTSNIPLASGASVPLSSASFSPGAIAGAGLRAASARGELRSVALDSYRRAFEYDLGAGIAAAPRLSSDQIFGSADRRVAFNSGRTTSGAKLLYGVDTANTNVVRGQLFDYESRDLAQSALSGLAIVQPIVQPYGQAAELAFGFAGMGATYFGLSTRDGQDPNLFDSLSMASPIFSLIPGHSHLGAGWSTMGGVKLKAGLVSSAGASTARAQFAPSGASQPAADAYVLEAANVGERGAIGATVMQLRERAAYFNSTSGDAYRISATPTTTAVTLFTNYEFAPAWSLAGQFTVADTPGFANTPGSLIAGVSATNSRAFALGLARANLHQKGDRITITYSQPLRATSGVMALDLPTGVDSHGEVVRTSRAIPLNPAGRERVTEFNYSRPLGRGGVLGISVIHRAEPSHDAAAPNERVIALRYAASY